MKMILVTGGTGQIGVFLIPRLLAAGCHVVALSRRVPIGAAFCPPAADGQLIWVHPAALGPKAGAPGVVHEAIETLVSAGPLGLAPGLLERCAQIRQAICFSSSSVLVKSDSPVESERATIERLAAAERVLEQACSARAIPLLLLRPTLVYGCGLDRNVSRIAAWTRRYRFMPVAGPAAGLRQPVHADDLAALAAGVVRSGFSEALTSPVCGGDTISYRDMVARVFAAFGLRPRLAALPPRVLSGFAHAAGRLFRVDGLNAQTVLRQNRDLVFDDRAIRERLGFDPRPFRPTAEDFMVPAAARSLQPR